MAIAVLLGVLVTPRGAVAQQTTPGERPPDRPAAAKTLEAPVWKPADLGRYIVENMASPIWGDDSDRATGVDRAALRLELQVIEAHAVGQALRQPFAPAIARQTFKEYFVLRFEEDERVRINAELKKWGIAYSSAIELAAGDETRLFGYISNIFANSLDIDESSDLAVWASTLWKRIVDAVSATCQTAVRQAVVVAED
jgi:hypothetical protein